jgi:predicted Rossmann fold nucleotide-binding protein DprA/Smf involved in DNA uptake
MLIKNGMAKLTTSSEDILVEYNILKKASRDTNKKRIFADKIEENIYNILILENLTINELINKIGLDIKTLSFKLSMMEINNIIKKSL